jgi:hypothetical protein
MEKQSARSVIENTSSAYQPPTLPPENRSRFAAQSRFDLKHGGEEKLADQLIDQLKKAMEH